MINIKTKTDIIIPFQKIGDENWQHNTQLIINELADNWGNDPANAISTKDISELEQRLGTSLPKDLALFYQTFGIADIGETLLSLDEIGKLQDLQQGIVDHLFDNYTQDEKEILPNLIAFSDYLGNGNMFCFHGDSKQIYYFDHDTAPYICKLFNEISDYIKACLIYTQRDLFNTATGQERVEQWCEEVVIELFGHDIVRKWQY